VQSTLGVSLRLERYCVDYTKRAQNAALQTQRFQRSCRMAQSVNTGTKEDASDTEHIWAAGFHHVTARSRLTHVLKLTNSYFF
jgi:ribosomal protein L31E